MNIKDYLDSIGIFVEDNEAAQSFMSQDKVKSFLSDAWSENKKREEKADIEIENEPDVSDQEVEDVQIQNTEIMGLIPGGQQPPMEDAAREKAQDEAFALCVKNNQFTLQNGKVNQPYYFALTPSVLEACQIGKNWFEGLDEIGLEFDETESVIKGTPIKAGDHKISWHYKHKDWEEEKPALKREITLVINPDPRSLWNNIPTSKDIPFYKEDSDKQFVEVEAQKKFLGLSKEERKDLVAASQRGRSHAHEGSPRDDDFKLSYDKETEWYTMVVADGAGSAKYSRRGSEIACKTVISVCDELLKINYKSMGSLVEDYHKEATEERRKNVGDALYKILGSAVFKAYKEIENEAKASESQIKDFSTTLLVAICRKFKFGWFVASFWVGDGAIAIYDKENQNLKVMGESDGGEFAGQTRFLTMPEIITPNAIYSRLRFEIVEDFTALMLMTDGITDPKFETDANLQRIEKWNNLWNDLNTEVTFDESNKEIDNQLLKWLDFWSPGNHDDRTIAILF
ncbi:MAG: PP2C family serine/threonine-protein phosphatase [Dysgonomonas sp.]